jgi:hypothetical protein
MDIIKEQFNKLNQLDRIEFRQKRELIKSEKIDLCPWQFMNFIYFIIGFSLLMFLQLWQINLELANSFMMKLSRVYPMMFLFAIALFLGNILFELINKKRIKELNQEYFEVKCKKK